MYPAIVIAYDELAGVMVCAVDVSPGTVCEYESKLADRKMCSTAPSLRAVVAYQLAWETVDPLLTIAGVFALPDSLIVHPFDAVPSPQDIS